MVKIRSLRLRLLIFVLTPVAFLLLFMGIIGFYYTKQKLHAQWQETVLLELQQTAHKVDMRLSRPKQLLGLYAESINFPHADLVQSVILDRLRAMDGVATADVFRESNTQARGDDSGMNKSLSSRNFMRAMPTRGRPTTGAMGMDGRLRITPPYYSRELDDQVVTLALIVEDPGNRGTTRVEVALRFDYLVKNLMTSGTWHSKDAILVDQKGNILTGTRSKEWPQSQEGESLERITMEDIKTKPYGTVHSSSEMTGLMVGFYHLEEAPWSLVMFASAKEVLSPILDLRAFYFSMVVIFSLLILLLVRLVTGRAISSINHISIAAEQLARGQFGPPLPVQSNDEVGDLTRSFNTMVIQLKDRLRIKRALDMAMEVQLSLLPQNPPIVMGLDIGGQSIYCDETGGDYYDFIQRTEPDGERLVVMVGDVSDHGLPSALLMTTARAFLRQRITRSGSLAEVLDDVNRLLAADTIESGLFMTLFIAEFNLTAKTISWSIAGHDPALVFDIKHHTYIELGGRGTALGIVEDYQYEDFTSVLDTGQIIVVGTDGIWEAQNPSGEQFGRQRFRETIFKNQEKSADNIIKAVWRAVEGFRGAAPIEDDLTLIVIKT